MGLRIRLRRAVLNMTTESVDGAHIATLLCSVDDVCGGRPKRVELKEHGPVAVFRLNGTFYTIDDTCTHAQASLAEGEVEGDIVICPAHFGRFHIPTGKAITFPVTQDLGIYATFVRDGHVFAQLPCARSRRASSELP